MRIKPSTSGFDHKVITTAQEFVTKSSNLIFSKLFGSASIKTPDQSSSFSRKRVLDRVSPSRAPHSMNTPLRWEKKDVYGCCRECTKAVIFTQPSSLPNGPLCQSYRKSDSQRRNRFFADNPKLPLNFSFQKKLRKKVFFSKILLQLKFKKKIIERNCRGRQQARSDLLKLMTSNFQKSFEKKPTCR